MLGLKKTGIKGTVLLVCVPLVGRDACLAVAMDGGVEAVARDACVEGVRLRRQDARKQESCGCPQAQDRVRKV
jgi:hypothetical protein